MSDLSQELRSVITDVVSGHRMATPSDVGKVWAEIVGIGLRDVALDESLGGSGGSLSELALIVELLAEHAVAVPIVESSVGRWAQAVSGVPLTQAPTVACPEPDTKASSVTLPWGRDCDVAVICRGSDVRLVRVSSLQLTLERGVDGNPLDRAVVPADGDVTLRLSVAGSQVQRRVKVLRTAALVGAARGGVNMTRSYVSQRHQFGGPLLKLPAVARNLALMTVMLRQGDAARAAALADLESSVEEPSSDVPTHAADVGLTTALRSACGIARLAHQLHGALGVTDEYPLHRLTAQIWAWRDMHLSEARMHADLGKAAVQGGEEYVWSVLTARAPMAVERMPRDGERP